MPNEYNFNLDHAAFNGGALINNGTINNTTYNAASDTDAVLQELAVAQKKLAEYAPKIADAIGELRGAIEKKDQKTIGQKLAELTTGTAAEIVKGVLGAAGSGAALRYLGGG